MTAQAAREVAAISLTMRYIVCIDHLETGHGEAPGSIRNLAREVADAIGGGRVVIALRSALPGAGAAAASVRFTGGHVTVGLPPAERDSDPSPANAPRAAPSTVLLPISRTDPGSARLMAGHQPLRPDWRCVTCATPWPCAIQRAILSALAYAGNGRGVGLTLTSNVACAWLDQPGTCPGCLTRQFLGWITDDLYALIVADDIDAAPGPATPDSPPMRDSVTGRAPDDKPQTRPRSRPFTPAAHLPNCSHAPEDSDRNTPPRALNTGQSGARR